MAKAGVRKVRSGWGGARKGAGRKRAPGPSRAPHRPRPPHDRRFPVYVTFQARRGLPSLRSARLYRLIAATLTAATGETFRIVHFSVQREHLHLIVEADSERALASGLRGLAIRGARAINGVATRHGAVWAGRYQSRALTLAADLRAALATCRSTVGAIDRHRRRR
jgi:hypothetical protein